jgi:hypothetical protein
MTTTKTRFARRARFTVALGCLAVLSTNTSIAGAATKTTKKPKLQTKAAPTIAAPTAAAPAASATTAPATTATPTTATGEATVAGNDEKFTEGRTYRYPTFSEGELKVTVKAGKNFKNIGDFRYGVGYELDDGVEPEKTRPNVLVFDFSSFRVANTTTYDGSKAASRKDVVENFRPVRNTDDLFKWVRENKAVRVLEGPSPATLFGQPSQSITIEASPDMVGYKCQTPQTGTCTAIGLVPFLGTTVDSQDRGLRPTKLIRVDVGTIPLLIITLGDKRIDSLLRALNIEPILPSQAKGARPITLSLYEDQLVEPGKTYHKLDRGIGLIVDLKSPVAVGNGVDAVAFFPQQFATSLGVTALLEPMKNPGNDNTPPRAFIEPELVFKGLSWATNQKPVTIALADKSMSGVEIVVELPVGVKECEPYTPDPARCAFGIKVDSRPLRVSNGKWWLASTTVAGKKVVLWTPATPEAAALLKNITIFEAR